MKRRKFSCALLLLLALCMTGVPAGASDLLFGPLAVVPPASQRRITRRAVVWTESSEETAALYAAPDLQAEVLMTYYAGVPLEVIRAAGGDFCLVQAGTQEAGLMGYMRMQDIRIGETADREVGPCFMRLEFNREAQVYAYCDEGAQVIGACTPGKTYYAMGKNDGKWVQLFLPAQMHVWEEEDRIVCGFVQLETGMARGYWQEPEQWTVEPVTGEITAEQAIELAMDYLDGSGTGGIPDVYIQRAQLEKMDRRAQLRIHRNGREPVWWVYFWQRVGSDAVYVSMQIDPDGGQSMSQGYIAEDDWDAYAVTPML